MQIAALLHPLPRYCQASAQISTWRSSHTQALLRCTSRRTQTVRPVPPSLDLTHALHPHPHLTPLSKLTEEKWEWRRAGRSLPWAGVGNAHTRQCPLETSLSTNHAHCYCRITPFSAGSFHSGGSLEMGQGPKDTPSAQMLGPREHQVHRELGLHPSALLFCMRCNQPGPVNTKHPHSPPPPPVLSHNTLPPTDCPNNTPSPSMLQSSHST